jgi:hypothetical protein
VKGLAITLSGQNLLTFSGLDFIDPENANGRLNYYPQQMTFNIGINLTF